MKKFIALFCVEKYFKKFQKSSQKPIDKRKKVCYNIGTLKARAENERKFKNETEIYTETL